MKIKKLGISIILTIFCFAVNAQQYTNKINFKKDKDYEIFVSTKVSMDMSGMDITSIANVTASSKIIDFTDENYKLKTKIIKYKIFGGAGENSSVLYDSEGPESENNPEIASAIAGKIVAEKILSINRMTGEVADLSSPEKKDTLEVVKNLLNAEGSNDTYINDMFLIIPKGKKTGDSWTTTVGNSDNETINTYTIKEIKNGVATINFTGVNNVKQTINNQGVDMFMHFQNNSTGTIIVSAETAILKKKTVDIITEGATEIMGNSSTLKIKTTSVITYNEK
ncbi:MAG: hypothetical protein ABIP68_02430 [Ferruginibacter sp.]